MSASPELIPYVLNRNGFMEPVLFVEPKRGGALAGRCFTCGKGVVHGRGELSATADWLGSQTRAPHGYGRRTPHCCNYGYSVLLPCGSVVDGWATRREILDELTLTRQPWAQRDPREKVIA